MGILDKGAGIAAAVAAVEAHKQLSRHASPLAGDSVATTGCGDSRGRARAERAETKPHEAGATRAAGQRV
ncbi:hypothetical protein [Paraburkholderia pallida]|uniref:Uncharacterized protein n=1 Tax=Paraburkholderia pallida TaxID=2547399 RepID=A0A4P7CXY0_9BURK|nr:hypothetical protein [Paraburkholderia pallida]QBR00328.1 hypothetical protein E1956_25065 [Paraburkholderia pallida]